MSSQAIEKIKAHRSSVRTHTPVQRPDHIDKTNKKTADNHSRSSQSESESSSGCAEGSSQTSQNCQGVPKGWVSGGSGKQNGLAATGEDQKNVSNSYQPSMKTTGNKATVPPSDDYGMCWQCFRTPGEPHFDNCPSLMDTTSKSVPPTFDTTDGTKQCPHCGLIDDHRLDCPSDAGPPW